MHGPIAFGNVDELWQAGVAFFKVFTCTTHGVPGFQTGPLLELFERTSSLGAVCLVHSESESVTSHAEVKLRREGRSDGGVIPEWRSRDAEVLAVSEVLLASRLRGASVVIADASHPEVFRMAREARGPGTSVAVETCPQYLTLFEQEAIEYGALRKFTCLWCNPACSRGLHLRRNREHGLRRAQIASA